MKKITLTCIMLILCSYLVPLNAQNAPFAANFSATDELLIRFQDGVSQDYIDSLRTVYNADLLGITPITHIQLWKIRGFTADFPTIIDISEDARSRNPRVTSCDPNYLTKTAPNRNQNQNQDDMGNGQELLDELLQEGCDNCLGYSLKGLGDMRVEGDVKIAIMDSGIDGNGDLFTFNPNHMSIFDNMYDVRSYDFMNNNNMPKDENGHGTHVAGIIAKILRLSPAAGQVKLLILKTQAADGYGSLWHLCRAFDYAMQENVTISNLSLTWVAPTPEKIKQMLSKKPKDPNHGLDDSNLNDDVRFKDKYEIGDLGAPDMPAALPIMNFVLNFAQSQKMLVIGAAANDGTDVDNLPDWDVYPARLPNENLIVVTSTECLREQQLSDFANWGTESVDIAAAGRNIFSTYLDGRFKKMSGTSMSTAMVTAAAALSSVQNRWMDWFDIKNKILSSVTTPLFLEGQIQTRSSLNILQVLDLPTPDLCGNNERRQKNPSQNGLRNLTTAPNPFIQSVMFNLTSDANVTANILITNTLGQVVFEKKMVCEVGDNALEWQSEDMPNGIYVVQVQLNQNIITRKIVKQ